MASERPTKTVVDAVPTGMSIAGCAACCSPMRMRSTPRWSVVVIDGGWSGGEGCGEANIIIEERSLSSSVVPFARRTSAAAPSPTTTRAPRVSTSPAVAGCVPCPGAATSTEPRNHCIVASSTMPRGTRSGGATGREAWARSSAGAMSAERTRAT